MIGKASRDDRGRSTAVCKGATMGQIEQHSYGVVVGTCSVADEGAVFDVLCSEATTTRRACPPEGGVVLRGRVVSDGGDLVYTVGSRRQRW